MKTMKLMSLAIAVLVAILIPNAVQAQKGGTVSFQGIEISTGHEDLGESYGWMCYAKTTGTFPGNLTLSIDYQGAKTPGTSAYVTGGAWTLPVYGSLKSDIVGRLPIRGDQYQGVLFGSVASGSITWDKTGANATVELEMSIQGGTQSIGAFRGRAMLYGEVIYDEKTGVGTFAGKMYFEFE